MQAQLDADARALYQQEHVDAFETRELPEQLPRADTEALGLPAKTQILKVLGHDRSGHVGTRLTHPSTGTQKTKLPREMLLHLPWRRANR
ncbi:MAG: hypothetical protein RIR76_109 [Verrucomicrobiota bacterium]